MRSSGPALWLEVHEPWRSGDPVADGLLALIPARVTALPGARVLLAPFSGAEFGPATGSGEMDDSCASTGSRPPRRHRWMRCG